MFIKHVFLPNASQHETLYESEIEPPRIQKPIALSLYA
jgi:hypothetical protein